MDSLIVLAVVLAITIAVLVWLSVQWRRRRSRSAAHDDTIRVGDKADVDSATAWRRAEGKAAWTRISGGGM